jgi:hypothetical protein
VAGPKDRPQGPDHKALPLPKQGMCATQAAPFCTHSLELKLPDSGRECCDLSATASKKATLVNPSMREAAPARPRR